MSKQFIEDLHKYVKIVTKGKNYTSLIGLTEIEKELPINKFYRCLRSFIVNFERIQLIDSDKAFISKFNIPISKNNKEHLISKMGKKNRVMVILYPKVHD